MDEGDTRMSMDDDNDDVINERRPILTDVALPSEGYVLVHWTVPLGSAVGIGMTIAYARLKDKEELDNGDASGSIGASTIATTTTVESSSATISTTTVPTHKRPMRRRRPGGAAEHIGLQKQILEEQLANKLDTGKKLIVQDDFNPSSSSSLITSSSSSAALGIRERLAAKLGTKKLDKTVDPESTDAVSNEPTTGATAVSENVSNPISVALSSQGKATSVPSRKENIPILAPAAGLLRVVNHINTEKSLLSDSQTKLSIGYIEECLHPTVLDGLCVVCGSHVTNKLRPSSASISSVSSPSEIVNVWSGASPAISGDDTFAQLTVSGGITMAVSQRESRQMALMDSERLFSQRRLALVLDLDHTLVHATSDPRAQQHVHNYPDVRTIRLPMMEGAPSPSEGGPTLSIHPQMLTYHYIKLRPHINEFLTTVQSLYEVTVYTAGTRSYAQEITMVLCRSMVGSTMDCDDIERLRYQVKMAEAEYAKHRGLQQQQLEGAAMKGDSAGLKDDDHDDEYGKKRKAAETIPMDKDEDKDNGCNGKERSKKRKKVSFGFQETGNDEVQPPTQRSDHMTRETLENMKQQLRDADDLEQRAVELRQILFGSRVVSRTDVGDLGRDVKSLRRIFPCGGSMAAVVDDREDVWANARDNTKGTLKGEPPDNLLLVRPYHWKRFVGFADINNAAGTTLSRNGDDGTDSMAENDQQLLWTRDILVRLHQRYYQQSDEGKRLTVPETLSNMRREVLKGSTVVFTGFPLPTQGPGSRASRPTNVRYAQNLGAKVQDKVEYGVTHVVAARDGTDKWIASKKIPGCALVKPGWLEESNWSMTNRDVEPFLISRGVGEVPKSSTQYNDTTIGRNILRESNVENSSDGSSNDTDDDNFAAELEEEFMSD